jgi:hypothetical protein
MKSAIATAGVVGLTALAFQTSDAAVLNGFLSNTANTCPAAIGGTNGDDCSYNDSFAQSGSDPWIGPDRSSAFYSSSLANGNWTVEPTPGDGKVAPALSVNLTISGSNVVSGTIVIGPVAYHNFSAGPSGRGEDGWTSATITLTPKTADSVAGNTYVIGSAGFPSYLQSINSTDQFPSETGADSNLGPTPDVPWWSGPSPVGITHVEGTPGTIGTLASAAVVGWTCNDTDGVITTGACNSASSFRGRGNFENVLLRIQTDGAGNATFVEGFLVQGGAGTANPFTTPNWVAWTFSAGTPIPVPGAVWLLGGALAGLGWLKRRQ